MSDRSTVERPAATARRNADVSINHLTFLIGVGAIVAAVVGGSCSTNARISDVRAEIRDVRAQVEALEDSTAASFATVHRQLAAVAVCIIELRNLVGGGEADGGGASTACDSAVRAILAPSAPTGL